MGTTARVKSGRPRRREAILEAVSFAAERFLKAGQWETEMPAVLARLGEAACVSRVSVFEKHLLEDGQPAISERFEWVAEGIPRSGDVNPLTWNLPYREMGLHRWERALQTGEIIQGHVRRLSPAERCVFRPAGGLKSFAFVPIPGDGEPWGMIGFDECVAERKWSTPELEALRAAASMLGAAIQRKHSEAARREQEQLYRRIVETSLEGIWQTDVQGITTFVNARLSTMLGYTEEEMIGRSFLDFQHEPERAAAQARFLRRLAGEHGQRDVILCRKNGSLLPAFASVAPVIGADGRVCGVLSMVTDLSDRVRAEQALRHSEARYALAVQAGRTAVWDCRLDTREFMTHSYKDLLGYDDHDLGNQLDDWLHIVPEEDRPRLAEALSRHLSGETPEYRCEHRLVRKDGQTGWFLCRGSIVEHVDGRAVRLVGTSTDITERVLTEQGLREYEKAIESSSDLITAFDRNYVHHLVNQAFLNYRRLTRDQVLGKTVADVTGTDVFETEIRPYADRCLAGETVKFEIVRNIPLTGLRHMQVLFSPLRAEQDRVVGLVTVMRDVTDYVEVLRRLEVHQREIQDLSRRLVTLQEEERANLARELHDRVGPLLTAIGINLNVIGAGVSHQADSQLSDRVNDALELVDKAADCIRDVMADLRPAILDDYGLVPALKWYCHRYGERTALHVQVRAHDETVRLGSSVEIALFRIACEALTNVVKHARATRVILNLKESEGRVWMEIQDDGAGFDPESARRSPHPGWGLVGMRERALAVDGSLIVESQPGAGTRVCVEVNRTKDCKQARESDPLSTR